jgi:hypothetical protein
MLTSPGACVARRRVAGEVTAVRISGRFAWVEFLDVRAANAALALDGETTGGHHLRVSQSKSAIHSNGLKKRAPAGVRSTSRRPASSDPHCVLG